jgi:hypothetical protein
MTEEEVRLRRKAQHTDSGVSLLASDNNSANVSPDDDDISLKPLSEQQVAEAAIAESKTINVALVGNPNCG